jgi:hypothetical protein
VIFVFAAKPLKRFIIKPKHPVKPIELCQQQNSWTFHELCTHFARVEGDKAKNKQFVVDYTWVDDCIASGMNDQSSRWQGKEVM